MGLIHGSNGGERSASSEPANKTNTEPTEKATHGQRAVQSRPSGNWLTRVWECLFPNRDVDVQDREIKTTSEPQVYHHFRQVGCGANGLVDLAHQSPENSKNVSDNPLDVEQYFEKGEERPAKVPGIRRAARQNSPEVNNSAALLARKTYISPAASPMEDTEYRLLNQLKHRNIIGLVDSRITTETTSTGHDLLRISLLTESGIASLDTVARKAHPLPAQDVARMMDGVLAGVKHLHEHRITHSDLNPRNVVLMPDMTTKLIDFGSAREFGDGVEQLECGVMGTPGYVAPDISLGAEAQLATFEQLQKADYWAVGCILYELVTGERLFDEQPEPDDDEDMNAQVNERIVANMPEGWKTDDVQALQECLNELLRAVPEQRQVKRLETFVEKFGDNG